MEKKIEEWEFIRKQDFAKTRQEIEIQLIDRIDKDLKLLWKEQGIRPEDSLRQEIENILGYK